MVRLSDVLGPDGTPKRPVAPRETPREKEFLPKEPPSPVSPLKEAPILPREEKGTEAEVLYQAALAWIRKKFEEAGQGPVSDIREGPEIVERILKILSSDGEELLVLTSASKEENYLYPHSVNVSILSIKVGQGLHLDQKTLIQLGVAALLHDLGMAKVPQALIEKPTALTEEEMAIVKKHPIYTVQLLEKTDGIEALLLDAISHEHERLDGAGYPKGLREDQISEFGGIIAIVDVYEALTHLRPYRKRYTADEAMKMIAYSMGGQFKPALIRILKALVRELSVYPIGSYVQLNTKEIGRVVKVNRNFPLLPILDIYLDGSGNRLAEVKRIDLAQEPLLHIKKPVDIFEVAKE